MKHDFSRLDKLLEEFASRTVPGCTCSIMEGDELVLRAARAMPTSPPAGR